MVNYVCLVLDILNFNILYIFLTIYMTQKFGRLGIALEKLKNLKFSYGLQHWNITKARFYKNIFFNKNFI